MYREQVIWQSTFTLSIKPKYVDRYNTNGPDIWHFGKCHKDMLE